LTYTAAGFVVLGGLGAMEAARPPLVTAAHAGQTTLRSSVSPRALLATIASDAPSWTQRLHFDLASNVVVAATPAVVAAVPTPYYPAPDTAWSKGAPPPEPQAETAAATTAPEAQEPAAPSFVTSVIAAVLAQPQADDPAVAPVQPEPTITVAMSAAPLPVAQSTAESAATTAPAVTAAPATPATTPVETTDDSSSALINTLNWVYDRVDPAPEAETVAKDAATAAPAPTESTAAPAATSAVTAPVEVADNASSALVATLNWVYDRVDTPVTDYSAPEVSAETPAATPAPAGPTDTSPTQTADASNADATPVLDLEPDLGFGTASPETAAAVQDSFSPGAQKVIQVRRGDTLFKLLTKAGLSDAEAQDASHSLADVFSPSDLKVGQQITLNFATGAAPVDADGNKLLGLTLTPSVERDVKLTRDSEGQFVAAAVDRPLTERIDRAAGEIDVSLFESAHDAGLPAGLIGDVIKAYSYDVDFQRDIHEGDSFEVLYERFDTPTGELAKPGKLLYAALTLGGKPMAIYYFERDGDGAYYTADGSAVRKSLLKTPIDGAKITSGYGMRVNPILGYSAMHQGIDFGAPMGTPIFAAGNGVIEQIGQVNGYGNYIKVRHNGTYETAYAHISRFASGMKRGTKVKQGQVIAYVGETGRATGPHLHFEIMVNGQHVNPSTVKTVAEDKLNGKDLKAFKTLVASIAVQRRTLAQRAEIADQSGNSQLDCTHQHGGCQN
jgi:murein DD-endopeptidase MepM/ murein hydrolase activator NlpD